MGSYLSLLSYPKQDKEGEIIDLFDKEEQYKIGDSLHFYFMTGQKHEIRPLTEEASWSIGFEVVHEIWSIFPVLYQCEDYGDVKYIPEEEVDDYLNKIYKMIQDAVSDVDKLLQDTANLNVLIDFYKELHSLKEQNDVNILFVWG